VIPEIVLHRWARERESSKNIEIKDLLQSILESRTKFSPTQFERLHGKWECLVRLLRREEWLQRGEDTVEKLSLLQRYNGTPGAVLANKTKVLKVPTDQTTKLVAVKYNRNTKLTLTPNTIVYPASKVQEGWDTMIVLEAFPQEYFSVRNTKYLVPLFIQNKWYGDTATISEAVVKSCFQHCDDFMRDYAVLPEGYSLLKRRLWFSPRSKVDKFVVMFVANAQHTDGALDKAPRNVLTLFREHLPALYGPTVSAYLQTLRFCRFPVVSFLQ
jgi:hypothetical protein